MDQFEIHTVWAVERRCRLAARESPGCTRPGRRSCSGLRRARSRILHPTQSKPETQHGGSSSYHGTSQARMNPVERHEVRQ